MMLNFLKTFFLKVGIDKTIALTMATRVIQAGGGVVSIFFIANFLSKDEQGYFYTFASILAIQVFFELGLSGIITQYTAHEFAHLRFSEKMEVVGEEYYKSRLSSLLRFCIKWFGIISVFLFFILVGVGFYFFGSFTQRTVVDWKLPWIILCLSTSLNLFIDPLLAYFDGLGEVEDMAKVRLIQKTTLIVTLFIFLALDFKLYASALSSVCAILINYIQILFSKRRIVLIAIWKLKSKWAIDYMKEIFPYQWKIALSWISGYFIFQLFNPILFASEGALVAGQMGMTLQALTGISAISMSWITTKIPRFSAFIAKKEYHSLDILFNSTIKQLTLANLFLVAILFVFVAVLNYYNFSFAERFLPLLPLALLGGLTILNQLVFSWATYLRCHKQEPYLVNSIVIGILCALSTFILGDLFGLYGIVIGYTFISAIIGLPWAYFIFINKKRDWHG